MPAAKPQHVNAPSLAPATLDDGDDWAEVRAEGDYVGLGADDVVWADVVARKGRWSGATIDGFQATDVTFDTCDLSGVVLQGGVSLRRVAFVGCRMTGAVLAGAHMRDVAFVDCVFDDANLRMIDALDVVFDATVLTGADFYAAKLTDVAFMDCELRGVDWTKASLTAVDLRTSRVGEVRGADALRGATIDSGQAIALAHSLAVAVGITVADDDA